MRRRYSPLLTLLAGVAFSVFVIAATGLLDAPVADPVPRPPVQPHVGR